MSESNAPQRKVGGLRTILTWLAVSVVTGILCWYLKGPAALETALLNYEQMIIDLVPRMSSALIIAGFVQVLVPRSLVAKWLGDGSGIRGIFLAHGVGALTPGGPILAFPLVAVLRNSGASMASVITFTTSWATLGTHRIILWELPFLGPEFALVRYLSSIPLGLIAGFTVLLWIKFLERNKDEKL